MRPAPSAPFTHAPPPRVLVLDDDPVFRAYLRRLLDDSGCQVVGLCANVAAARRRLEAGGVDAVTIDLVLRDESGLELLAFLQQKHPKVKAVLVTAAGAPGARNTVDSILLGATAFIQKPSGPSAERFEKELSQALTPHRLVPSEQPPVASPSGVRAPGEPVEVVAIGASTGGPPVLLQILSGLPRDFAPPIVVTQHLPPGHVEYLADSLEAQARRQVQVGGDGEALRPGRTYLAGGGKHLLVERATGGLRLRLDDGPEEHHCKPAVDPMFRSLGESCPRSTLAVVVSGMGQDGAKGALALRQAGSTVLVQDAASSVVWGMPGATVQVGGADRVLPATALAQAIVDSCRGTLNQKGRR